MPEHLRALVVILILATVVFVFAKTPACAVASTPAFERRRNLWFAITLAVFLAHNFWVYIFAVAMLLLFALPRESNKLALYYFLLFAAPAISADIPGLGIINYFFAINYIRLLSLAVLLPAFLSLRAQPDTEPVGRPLADKLLLGYMILQIALMLKLSTITNAMRIGGFYQFIDVFLPYYVASRSLKSRREFTDALMAFVVAALVLSVIGAFEYARHWLLYANLEDVLGVHWSMGNYLGRGESLRAQGSAGQPIPFGYAMAVAAGLFLYLRKSVPNLWTWRLGLAALIAGLIASLSRGPWVGAAGMLLVFIATSPSPGKNLVRLGLFGLIIVSVLLISPAGQNIIDHLPFVGTLEASTITYRQRLLEISLHVMMQNPFFGAADYFYSPAMQELQQGGGMIDMVNSYLGVGLTSGFVGLFLFAGFFIVVVASIFKNMRRLADRNDESYLLGRVLLSTLVGILIIIITVSSITIIPVIYWSMAGVGVAYARMLALAKTPRGAAETS